jgi:hypothetical protein
MHELDVCTSNEEEAQGSGSEAAQFKVLLSDLAKISLIFDASFSPRAT